MATRNLSLEYAELRAQHRSNYPRGSDGLSGPDASAASDVDLTTVAIDSVPDWVAIKEAIHLDVQQLKEDLHLLQKLQEARLRINFDADSMRGQDAEIQQLVDAVTQRLRKCEQNIKRIALTGGDPRRLQQQERQIMMNAMRACAIELNAHSKSFRHAQKTFLDSLRQQQTEEQQEAATGAGPSSSSQAALSDSVLNTMMDPNQQLDEAQRQQLELMQDESQDRMQEIIKVAQSINELASLFKELNVLVIEQGTILDRIDYNVEQTVERVKKGVVDLDEADKISKKALTTKCIAALIAVVTVLLLALIIKLSAKAS